MDRDNYRDDLRAFIWTFRYEDGTSDTVIDPLMTDEEGEEYIKKHNQKGGKRIIKAWPRPPWPPRFYGQYKKRTEIGNEENK